MLSGHLSKHFMLTRTNFILTNNVLFGKHLAQYTQLYNLHNYNVLLFLTLVQTHYYVRAVKHKKNTNSYF